MKMMVLMMMMMMMVMSKKVMTLITMDLDAVLFSQERDKLASQVGPANNYHHCTNIRRVRDTSIMIRSKPTVHLLEVAKPGPHGPLSLITPNGLKCCRRSKSKFDQKIT